MCDPCCAGKMSRNAHRLILSYRQKKQISGFHKNVFIKPSSSNPNAPNSNKPSKCLFICTFSHLINTSIFRKYHGNFIHLSLLLAHHRWHSCSKVNSGPPCGKSGVGHPVSKGGSGKNHSGLRWVGGYGAWSGARSNVCCRWCGLLPLLAGRGTVCHGHGLLSDLMHNGLHEFWR